MLLSTTPAGARFRCVADDVDAGRPGGRSTDPHPVPDCAPALEPVYICGGCLAREFEASPPVSGRRGTGLPTYVYTICRTLTRESTACPECGSAISWEPGARDYDRLPYSADQQGARQMRGMAPKVEWPPRPPRHTARIYVGGKRALAYNSESADLAGLFSVVGIGYSLGCDRKLVPRSRRKAK